MTKLHNIFRNTRLSLWLLICVLALTATSVYAESNLRPMVVTIIGDPDAAVTGKFAVGTGTPGNKALTVAGVIDFVGAGTVSNYFTQGPGNNMQIRSNVDETNVPDDYSKSQWNMVMGASLDQFSIRRSPPWGAYNEDALFFIDGATGKVGITTVDTANGGSIPFTPQARLHVQTGTGDAILGISTTTADYMTGVFGQSNGPTGNGVIGLGTSTYGFTWGVGGIVNSTDGFGVSGVAAATTGINVGVYGTTYSTSGYAGYFDGYVHVNGILSKGGGSFKIDHPLDPEFRYLQHSFVESPDMKNIYDGVVTLDENGEAWVELPPYFEALNMDFRYQLTPLGSSMPDLYIARGIEDNVFQIAGGAAEMQVSWQVTGIRHDPFAEANRIQVEVDKPPEEQGTYLFPELYGQPPEMAPGTTRLNDLLDRIN